MSENIVDYLLELLEKKGSDIQYGNEDVTQLEHALQCAELAEQNNKSDAFITAALLHDIGHLLYEDKDPIHEGCLLYTSPSPRDLSTSRMPSSA